MAFFLLSCAVDDYWSAKNFLVCTEKELYMIIGGQLHCGHRLITKKMIISGQPGMMLPSLPTSGWKAEVNKMGVLPQQQQQQYHQDSPSCSEKKTKPWPLPDGAADLQDALDDGFGPGVWSRHTSAGPDGTTATNDGGGLGAEEVSELEQLLWESEQLRLGLLRDDDDDAEGDTTSSHDGDEEESEGGTPGCSPITTEATRIPDDRWGGGLGGRIIMSLFSEKTSSGQISQFSDSESVSAAKTDDGEHKDGAENDIVMSWTTGSTRTDGEHKDGTDNDIVISWAGVVLPRAQKEQPRRLGGSTSSPQTPPTADSEEALKKPATPANMPDVVVPIEGFAKKTKKMSKKVQETKKTSDDVKFTCPERAPVCRFCMFCGKPRSELGHLFCYDCGQRYPDSQRSSPSEAGDTGKLYLIQRLLDEAPGRLWL